jgi:glycosyltransferase involved in cell wall biosynthesis
MKVGSGKRIAVFIDWVLPKNKMQIKVMQDLGYSVTFFVNKYNPATSGYFRKNDDHLALEEGFFKRFLMIWHFFSQNRSTLHHAEIYPGGRFSFIYVLISRYFGVPPVCVERGDLLYYKKDGYPPLTRVSMWICYKMSEIVWYREPYMRPMLEEIGARNIYFLHNAVDLSPGSNVIDIDREKTVDFLWVNRIIPERRSDWFVNILGTADFKDTSNVLVGMLESSAFPDMQEFVRRASLSNLKVVDFVSDPAEFYVEASFFVLPADVVFANNALLEAMSYGVIPIIARQAGSELLVEDGVSGLIFDYNQQSFRDAMVRALALSKGDRRLMSQAALERVSSHFASGTYREGLSKLYEQINS